MPPPKDLTKLMVNSSKILRYETVPTNGAPEDAHRSFVIWYYMMDDSIMVIENKVRNSGVWEGKFRERDNFGDRIMNVNASPPRPFHPSDFFVGQHVTISAMPMRITRADEFTLNLMENDPKTWPMSSLELVGQKLQGLDWAKAPSTCSPDQLRQIVGEQLGFALEDQELITILRKCADDEANIQVARLREFV